MAIGARSAYVGLRRVRVMDYAVVNVEGNAAAAGGTARAQESRSSGTGYDGICGVREKERVHVVRSSLCERVTFQGRSCLLLLPGLWGVG